MPCKRIRLEVRSGLVSNGNPHPVLLLFSSQPPTPGSRQGYGKGKSVWSPIRGRDWVHDWDGGWGGGLDTVSDAVCSTCICQYRHPPPALHPCIPFASFMCSCFANPLLLCKAFLTPKRCILQTCSAHVYTWCMLFTKSDACWEA